MRKGKQISDPLYERVYAPNPASEQQTVPGIRYAFLHDGDTSVGRLPQSRHNWPRPAYSRQSLTSSMMKSRKAFTRREPRSSSGKIRKTSKGGPSTAGKTRLRRSFSRAT